MIEVLAFLIVVEQMKFLWDVRIRRINLNTPDNRNKAQFLAADGWLLFSMKRSWFLTPKSISALQGY